jgi:hypothetical protein
MRAEEVVVSDEEGGEGDGAVARGQAASGAHVVFVGAIEAFDELLEGAEFLRGRVAIFQADDLPQGMGGLGRGAVGVDLDDVKNEDRSGDVYENKAETTKCHAKNTAFYRKMHQLRFNRQESGGVFGRTCTDAPQFWAKTERYWKKRR